MSFMWRRSYGTSREHLFDGVSWYEQGVGGREQLGAIIPSVFRQCACPGWMARLVGLLVSGKRQSMTKTLTEDQSETYSVWRQLASSR
jgi:hypothetical protein